MGNKDCGKYFDKADKIQNDIDDLEKEIKRLSLFIPKDPKKTKELINSLKDKVKKLKVKKKGVLESGYACLGN